MLSYGAVLAVMCISYLSFSGTFFDILSENLDGVWSSTELLEGEGINLTCSHDSTRDCTAYLKIKNLVVENVSMQFVYSPAARWVGVKFLSEDAWILLRQTSGRLLVRVFVDSSMRTFLLERRQNRGRLRKILGKKGGYVCLIFLVIGLFKWVQIRFFSLHSGRQNLRHRRNLSLRSETRKKNE
ncbi:uncharacterized protein Tco025E_07166 [Trypanosoma conorhini]|uniref:Uncharacterized protein n=1 Tax=Trypanosoma conorhini TaxID=83891 RepID=A0A3R7NM30_9TRYP|nr:uncharacterized protein Tco025E_07166 [Trypanosoma conorhini]RNF08471.1 hypothetical protein Tco025E_07166 [Trypanosoma conorhini]